MQGFKNIKPKLIILGLGLMLFITQAYAEPPNLALTKKAVIEYKHSNAYIKDIELAMQALDNYIVYLAKANKHKKNLAIVLDIDETSLSNYDTLEKKNFFPSLEDLHAITMAANAPAIKPVLNMYKKAIEHNIAIFFITGRKASELQATIKNLKAAGYTKWQGLYIRNKSQQNLPASIYKAQVRRYISNHGYKIVASVGDQLSDFQGGYTGKVFKLPNPYYFIP